MGAAKPLKISALAAAALGLVSVNLAGEMAPTWMILSWSAWVFSFLSDRFPEFQAKLRQMETAAVVGMIGMLFLDFVVFHNSIFITVTHFLLLFQIVKLTGEKGRKDCLQIFLFSFFQILAACTLSVDPWHAAVLLTLIPTATAALFWNQMAQESDMAPGSYTMDVHRHYRRMAALICAVALPLNVLLTIIVFVLFPRLTLNAPLPGFNGNRMGYTEQVNLSQKGNLEQNSTVVLWLSFLRADERQRWSGYLRGDTLSLFNGHDWSAVRGKSSRIFTPDTNGVFNTGPQHSTYPLIHHAITLSDTSAGTLFIIGRPLRVVAALPALQESEGGGLHWLSALRKPLHYEVISEPVSDNQVLPVHLELPRVPLDRIRALASKVAGRGSALKQAQSIEQYLQANYKYSTNFGDHITENPVDTFLFDRREGACGHFASAMALMLRLQHIPSRLVAGYLKGEWNEPAQAVVIRERDAHAWVEAYIEGKGWISFDPSPRLAFGDASGRLWAHRFYQYNDYFGLLWNRFVIQYDLYSQIKAFEDLKGGSDRLGVKLASWWSKNRLRFHNSLDSAKELQSEADARKRTTFPWKEIGVLLVLAVAGFLLLARRPQASYDAAIRFYTRFLEKMARDGHPKLAQETGLEYAQRLSQLKPEQSEFTWHITERYYLARFKKEPS